MRLDLVIDLTLVDRVNAAEFVFGDVDIRLTQR